ncbi:MAG: hypothetical protein M3R17_04575 [Bacteroidota bacterium]|nr:hypothetical protein [Bacteroidota bacterium]
MNKPIPASYILNKVKFDLVYVSIVSLAVLFITDKYQALLPEMPLIIPVFIGTAISILLSIKLSQFYDRWWEARKVWGSIVNDSRSFVIRLNTLVANGNNAIIKKMAYRQVAWCYSLGNLLECKHPAWLPCSNNKYYYKALFTGGCFYSGDFRKTTTK